MYNCAGATTVHLESYERPWLSQCLRAPVQVPNELRGDNKVKQVWCDTWKKLNLGWLVYMNRKLFRHAVLFVIAPQNAFGSMRR